MKNENNKMIEQNKREQKVKDFGTKLKKIMKDKNISSNKLANLVGINRSSFNKYFDGESSPRLDTFLSICEILKVEPNYFFETKFTDYQLDQSKSLEQKIIESLFFLFQANIIHKSNNFNSYFDYEIDDHNLDTLKQILKECEIYSESELVEENEISKKIVLKFEKPLKEEIENKNTQNDELPY